MQQFGFSFPYLVAPMVGISHVAFRELIRSYTPIGVNPVLFTEMLSTRKIPSEKLASSRELRVAEGELGFVPQLLGNEERFLAPSIEKLSSLNPWGFDINMGCPQTHVLKHNWGVRLMGDRQYAAQVVSIAKKYSKFPVSVKLRGGLDKDLDESYLLDFTSALEDGGADWITVHARSKEAKHEGPSDWKLVSRVAQARSIPVVANGDIQTAKDALHAVRDLGCGGAMIARAATARPWILWQIAEDLGLPGKPVGFEGRFAPRTPREEAQEFYRAFLKLIDLVELYFSSGNDACDYSLQKLRFYAAIAAKWFMFGHSFWRITMKSKTLSEMRGAVLEYSQKHEHEMVARLS